MLVSVLSSVHNEERWLDEFAESCLSQTYDNWEVVFVNDGSTDRTQAILERLTKTDQRFRIVGNGTKLGKTKAFTLAYEESRGDVVCLAAGDDRLTADSLRIRSDSFERSDPLIPTVMYGKLLTISEEKKYNNILLPRGQNTSKSGGSTTFNRALGNLLFPIDETLPTEDLWMRFVADHRAERVIETSRVLLQYRIHENNSNPRRAKFSEFTERMARRQATWQKLASVSTIEWTTREREELANLARQEEMRAAGNLAGILKDQKFSLIDRLATCSMANPILFAIRSRFYRLFTGLRGV